MPAIQTVARIVIIGDSENRCFHITFTCESGCVDQIKNKICSSSGSSNSSACITLKTAFPYYSGLSIEIFYENEIFKDIQAKRISYLAEAENRRTNTHTHTHTWANTTKRALKKCA